MAVYGKSTELLKKIGGLAYSNPRATTLNTYLSGVVTAEGKLIVNYLIKNGVSGDITFGELTSNTWYFNLIDDAMKMLLKVETLNSEISDTNKYGQDLAAFSEAINITYADFYSKIINEALEVGTSYRITDYKSVNFINGKENADNYIRGNYCAEDITVNNPLEIYTSDIEPIIVKAITKSEISSEAFSEMYPQDVIEFNPYVNTIGPILKLKNGWDLPIIDGTPLANCFNNYGTVSNFDLQWDGTNVYIQMPEGYPVQFGHFLFIYAEFDGGSYYQDGLWEPIKPGVVSATSDYSADYSIPMSRIKVSTDGMKITLLDLTETDYNNYNTDTLHVDNIIVVEKAQGWINRRNDTSIKVNVPFDFRNQMFRRFNVDLTLYSYYIEENLFDSTINWVGIGDVFHLQGTLDGDISSYSWSTYPAASNIYQVFPAGYDLHNVDWEGMGGPDYNYNAGGSDNNIFMGDLIATTFEDYTNNNTFLDNCYGNTFKYGTAYNIFGQISANIFGTDFVNNIIAMYGFAEQNNFLASSYFNNIIAYNDYFGRNTIGAEFRGNYQFNGDGFYDNFIGTNFGGEYGNTFYHYFNNNKVGNYFDYNTFSSATYRNSFGDSFYSNQFNYNTYDNNFGNNFQNNYSDDYFYQNIFGNDCSDNDFYYRVEYNTVGNHFRNNSGEGMLKHNRLGNHFRGNYWNSNFQQNTFENAQWFNWDSWNFSGATHVYDEYQTYVYQADNGDWNLSYNQNGTGLVYTGVNS